jgi:hypothetical protein
MLAVIAVSLTFNVLQVLQFNTLQSSMQNEIRDLNQEIDDSKKADPRLVNAGFVGNNFTGVIYNRGEYPARNVKVVLHVGSTSNEWTYEIDVGGVDGQDWEKFNVYIPTPEQYKYELYRPEIRWLP